MINTKHFTIQAVGTSPARPVPEFAFPKSVTLVSLYLNEAALENGGSGVFEYEDVRVNDIPLFVTQDGSFSEKPWERLPEEYKDLLVVLDLDYDVTSELIDGKEYIPYAIVVQPGFEEDSTLVPVAVAVKHGDTTRWCVPALDGVVLEK